MSVPGPAREQGQARTRAGDRERAATVVRPDAGGILDRYASDRAADEVIYSRGAGDRPFDHEQLEQR